MGNRTISSRPDIVAAVRGGDSEQGMDSEADPLTASLEQAVYWQRIYAEIVVMEEGVMARIDQLKAGQSPEARREVELSNVPVLAAQLGRFKQRRSYWEHRIQELRESQGSISKDPSMASLVAGLPATRPQLHAQQEDSAPG